MSFPLGFGFFILVFLCLLKTAFQLFAELVFCEGAKIFPVEKGSGEQSGGDRHFAVVPEE